MGAFVEEKCYMKCSEEEQWRLKCEQIENEAWGDISVFKEHLREALQSDRRSATQKDLINAAAGVALMHIDVMDAEDSYFGLEGDDDPDFVKAESEN
jgi:hypothetical protein